MSLEVISILDTSPIDRFTVHKTLPLSMLVISARAAKSNEEENGCSICA
jgi:hypothetical protein